MSTTLTEAVRELAAVRAALATVNTEVAAQRVAFEGTIAPLLAAQRECAARVTAAETTVKALAKAAYDETHEKKPAPGVEVKLFQTLSYDDTTALNWCRNTGVAVIPEQVDKKAFEKIAKATVLPFVQYAEEPRVTIATDLDKALAGAEVTL